MTEPKQFVFITTCELREGVDEKAAIKELHKSLVGLFEVWWYMGPPKTLCSSIHAKPIPEIDMEGEEL